MGKIKKENRWSEKQKRECKKKKKMEMESEEDVRKVVK